MIFQDSVSKWTENQVILCVEQYFLRGKEGFDVFVSKLANKRSTYNAFLFSISSSLDFSVKFEGMVYGNFFFLKILLASFQFTRILHWG